MSNRKHTGGKPPLYKTPEELQAVVDRYFIECTEKGIPPTLSGLSLYAGYSDRQVFSRQKRRSAAFSVVVQRARLRCEMYAEERLFSANSYRGAAFALRAGYGWGRENDQDTGKQIKQIRIINRVPDESSSTPAAAAHSLNIENMN